MKIYLDISVFFWISLILVFCSFDLKAAEIINDSEAYLAEQSYIRLNASMPIWGHSAISFRSCSGGTILSQSYSKHALILSVKQEIVNVTLADDVAGTRISSIVPVKLLDNQWHTIQFLYELGHLHLIIDSQATIIANSSYNKQFLSDQQIKDEAAVPIVGHKYVGCLKDGPGLLFQGGQSNNVIFGLCPLSTGACTGENSLLHTTINYCLHDPCMQHGECISLEKTYQCICTPKYSGRNCQNDDGAPCLKQPCQNGGECQDDNITGNFSCQCKPGFTGRLCETEIIIHPQCDKNSCFNNGTCIGKDNTFECICPTGFFGTKCELEVDECLASPCLNKGKCYDGKGGFTCDCQDTGYSGDICQNNIDECLNNPCLNSGKCYDTYGTYICECNPGYGGVNCEKIISECESEPCQQGGTCIDLKGSFKCKCPPGWTGLVCDMSLPCSQCPADSECIGGKCMCKPGSLGLIGNCIEISTTKLAKSNACSSICLNGATCAETASNITCICRSGFTGSKCESPLVLPFSDECSCVNGGTCNYNTTECICLPGFEGIRCERSEPCTSTNCIEPMVCSGNKCVCTDGINCAGPCSSSPCLNGATCIVKGNEFYCQCSQGFNGTTCTEDIDECQQEGVCGHGICVNKEGTFNCYCEPGFTGRLCDIDVDECLSRPCQNGATCINKLNDFSCVCPAGYNGKDCGTDIDECIGHPCANGSTCVDLVANFTCICMLGMTGKLCDIDIDDCESQPCYNNAMCIDQLGSFKCDCNGTGYTGLYCNININECDSNPCENGAICTDKINNYHCDCYSGYMGRNCEIDIDECAPNPCQYEGTCVEKSNISLYELSAIERNQLQLSDNFAEAFNYANASGYECICVKGTKGRICETNINECEPQPCLNRGVCTDGIGNFTCECEAGYEGILCDIDIDECANNPCIHGTCIDQQNNYKCDCDSQFGGKNCSVPLTGCLNSPCLNDGVCIPYLDSEIHHKFNCSCRNGFQGSKCEKITTMSLIKSSLVTVETARDEGYEIHLRFKTTLPNGILAFGNAGALLNGPDANSYILELVNGRLNLHSSLLNKWEGVFIGSGLNDSKWQKVFVAINSSHLVLSANEEQTIYPINSYEGNNASHTSFPLTYLGGTIPNLNSYLRHLTHAASSFVGCMEDVVINGQWIFPDEQNNYTHLDNVTTGCPRQPQCEPNPCNSNGECSDLWHTFSCSCQRPNLGPTCKYNIIAATFGNENTTHSAVQVVVKENERKAIRSVLDISMFIRTRQSTGQIFYLGSDPKKAHLLEKREQSSSYVAAQLNGGELLVKIQFNGTPEAYTVGGNKLDNGFNHLIQVIRNLTLVQVKLNGTEYFRKTLSSTGQLDAQILYLGGPPPVSEDDSSAIHRDELYDDKMFFKGIIQDVQVSNGSHAMMVELYPLNVPDLRLPPPFGDVTIDRTSVLEGEVTDDLCRNMPCVHGATCKNTWNDFACACPLGYKGRYCQEIEFCQLNKCPGTSICQNLDYGYECISNITFQGKPNEQLAFNFISEKEIGHSKVMIEISYKTKHGGVLFYVEDENDMYFAIIANSEGITIQWKFSSGIPENESFLNETSNFEWSTVYILIDNGKMEGGWKGWELTVEPSPLISRQIDQDAFIHLFSGNYFVYLGGVPQIENNLFRRLNEKTIYKGCLGESRINGYLLPYFSYHQIYSDSLNSKIENYFTLNSSVPAEGCVVCFEQDCLNGGNCAAPTTKYECNCVEGFAKEDCSENIDECLHAQCENNSTCIDEIASYQCACLPGYEGKFCQHEINECDSAPCHNGGTCTDLIASFSCNCIEEYAGAQCDVLRLVTCDNQPCRNGSTCVDGLNVTTGNNFTCKCSPGFSGYICDTPFCKITPCVNGVCLENMDQPVCHCELGFTGQYCEQEVDECESQPCQNNGQCRDAVASYHCNCTNTGYDGTNCESDIDECLLGMDNCNEKANCVNMPGSFKCQCPTGLCGIVCDITDPCIMLDHVCQNNGTCVEQCTTVSEYTCRCNEGFAGPNCSSLAARNSDDSSSTNLALIIVPIIVGLLVIAGGFLAAFLIMARNKRATRGTYSPSAQEYCNPRLEMDNVLKPPPEERLI